MQANETPLRHGHSAAESPWTVDPKWIRRTVSSARQPSHPLKDRGREALDVARRQHRLPPKHAPSRASAPRAPLPAAEVGADMAHPQSVHRGMGATRRDAGGIRGAHRRNERRAGPSRCRQAPRMGARRQQLVTTLSLLHITALRPRPHHILRTGPAEPVVKRDNARNPTPRQRLRRRMHVTKCESKSASPNDANDATWERMRRQHRASRAGGIAARAGRPK